MKRQFVYTRAFLMSWEKVQMDIENDLRRLQEQLLQDPKIGDVIQGTGRARKMRFAYEGKGKSGSIRVIYVDFEIGQKICALAAYAKSDKDDLSQKEKKDIRGIIDILELEYDTPTE